MRIWRLLALLVAGLAASGCVALPLVAPAAMSTGGDLVKEGTVRAMGGATFRTFDASLSEIYTATRRTLDRLGFAPPEEASVEEHVTLRARGIDRTVRIDLQPITGELTQMRVFVRKEPLGKDIATASAVVAQVEAALSERGARGNEAARAPRARR
jgi:hypothetical protein